MNWDPDIEMYWAPYEQMRWALDQHLVDGVVFYYLCGECNNLVGVTNPTLPIRRRCPHCQATQIGFDTLYL